MQAGKPVHAQQTLSERASESAQLVPIYRYLHLPVAHPLMQEPHMTLWAGAVICSSPVQSTALQVLVPAAIRLCLKAMMLLRV